MTLDQLQVNRLWEAVCRTTNEVVWELDAAGVITFIGGASEGVLGAPASEILGRTVFSIIHPEDVDRAMSIFVNCLARGRGWKHVRVRALASDGHSPWVESSGVAHLDASGRAVRFTATTRRLDVDEAREAVAQIARQRIEQVLAQRSLWIHWQPIFSLSDGRLVGVEALSRFPAPGPAPDRWFADAFSVGLGPDLEIMAIEKAVAEASLFPAGPHVALNVSPQTVTGGRLESVLATAPISPDRVVVELTEHASIDDYEATVAALAEVRKLGVRLAVDDAGAGFASFRHILRLGPDIIKLDRSITDGVTTNAAQRALATAIVVFALEVGSMTVTAEGVETGEDLSTLASLGIDAVQGFYVGRPGPAEDVCWDKTIAESWTIESL